MNQSLRISIWNANGLSNKVRELEYFLKFQKIDIMLVSETRFTEKSYVKIVGYTIYTTNHPSGNAHGGTAILIKNTIKHFENHKYIHDYLQSTSIGVQGLNFPLILSAIYCPPRHNIVENQFNAFFEDLGQRFIAGGDWNAKHQYWGSRLNTPRGRQLFKSVMSKNLQCLSTGEPSYWPSDSNRVPDLLDFFVCKGISSNYTHVESLCDLTSDHTPVILTLSMNVILKEDQPKLINNRTDLEYFRQLVESKIDLDIQLQSEYDIDEAVTQLTKAIQTSAWEASPPSRMLPQSYNLYPLYIREKIAERRQLRRQWQNTRYPVDKRRFNRASQEVKRLIRTFRDENFQKYVEGLSPTKDTQYSLWKATKTFKRPKNMVPPLRKTNGSWAQSGDDKANTFAEHLSDVFQPFPSEVININEELEIQDFLQTPFQMAMPIQSFEFDDIFSTIHTEINPMKSPGFDLITGRLLQELPKKALKFITLIFNSIIIVGYFPALWKISQIVMILKPGKNPNEVASYRPISLLSTLSKLFEKLFLKRLKPFLNDIVPNFQYGFREKHSTIEQVHRLVEKINIAFEKRQYCSAAFLDVRQAFDKVWHDGLLYKIKKHLPHSFYHVLKSYLSDRAFQIKYEDCITELYRISSGVPQGSVLGPVLYLLYTCDIPFTDDTITATYADDTAILAIHNDPHLASQYLQQNLNLLQNWMKKWRIRVNETKSSHVTFSLRKGNCDPVRMNDQCLPQVDEVRYLGLHLDRRLTWRRHIVVKRKQLDITFKKMYWLLGRKSKLSRSCKLLVYKSILKPIWTYGIELWGASKNSNIDIIERFQTKTLRNILNIPWYISNKYIYLDIKISTVKQEIRQRSTSYQNRLSVHPNYSAVNLLDNTLNNFVRLRRYNVLDNVYR
jgi:hypothetical protein